MADRQPAIEMHDVTVTYPGHVVALEHASLEIPKGVFCAVVGMNGSGKSTFFKAVMGLVHPTQGFASVFGEESKHVRKSGLVAYMPQTEEVDWDFPINVYDVVMMGRFNHMGPMRNPSQDDHDAVRQALQFVEMESFKDRQIGELSGGQKKRVFLARALAQDAPILLLDEPFAGVDAKTEHAITSLLLKLQEDGKTILMSIHELTSLSKKCDYVALINKTVVAAGPVEKVFTRELVEQTFEGALHHVDFDR